MDVKKIIAKFGGPTQMARTLGHKHVTTITSWRNRGKIPYWRIHEIQIAAKKNGIDISDCGAPHQAA
jgi:hypothetical protein